MTPKRQLIIGGPGCGKTTALLDILDRELELGTNPREIAFVSFTRKAILEAKRRVELRFGIRTSTLRYFRTLHSMAFLELGINRRQMMGHDDWSKIGELLGLRFTGIHADEEKVLTGDKGDRMLAMVSLSDARNMTLESIHLEYGDGISWFEFKQFYQTLMEYKSEFGKLEFRDLITRYLSTNKPIKVKVAIIDEAQDLSTNQWDMIHMLFANSERIYCAGDDIQALFLWSGADVNRFLNFDPHPIVLPISFRLPHLVFALANKISNRITKKIDKEWSPQHDRGQGTITWINDADELDLTKGQWLMLARNIRGLKQFETECRMQGVLYEKNHKPSLDPIDIRAIGAYEHVRNGKPLSREDAVLVCLYTGNRITGSGPTFSSKDFEQPFTTEWFNNFSRMGSYEKAYYRAVMRNGFDLQGDCGIIRLSTIHAAKGGEADNVVVCTDVSPRVFRNMEHDPDPEHRCFYVAITRTRENLFLMLPKTQLFYRV